MPAAWVLRLLRTSSPKVALPNWVSLTLSTRTPCLEHIPNPIEMLALMRESLVSGGVLCVVVPNDYNPFQETLREIEGYRPWWVAPPHHLNFFDFDSLGNLLEKMGFDVFLKETTFPMDMFLLMGDNYVDDGQLGRACHQKRIRFDTQLNKAGRNSSKRAFYQALANAAWEEK